jgi:DNA-binding response OmpR family regulator
MTKVLLVEDNLMLLESIAFELEMRGFTVWQANDGKNALHVLHSTDQHPDIIVSDIAMPEMDGYKLLELIRQNEDLQNIPVIFLTAFNSPNAIHLGKELGIDDYLVKPFNSDDLVTAINNKIKRYQQIHQQAP